MTDFWNDPPEPEEPPGCPSCGEPAVTVTQEAGTDYACRCDCGREWTLPAPHDPGPEDFLPVELPDDFWRDAPL